MQLGLIVSLILLSCSFLRRRYERLGRELRSRAEADTDAALREATGARERFEREAAELRARVEKGAAQALVNESLDDIPLMFSLWLSACMAALQLRTHCCYGAPQRARSVLTL